MDDAFNLENTLATPEYKSAGERQIAHFLTTYGLRFAYEQPTLVLDHGKPKIWYPDFYLPDFTSYIEYFGLAGDPHYDHTTKHKLAAYAQTGHHILPLYPWDLHHNWQDNLLQQLQTDQQRRTDYLDTITRNYHHTQPNKPRGYRSPLPKTYRRN